MGSYKYWDPDKLKFMPPPPDNHCGECQKFINGQWYFCKRCAKKNTERRKNE